MSESTRNGDQLALLQKCIEEAKTAGDWASVRKHVQYGLSLNPSDMNLLREWVALEAKLRRWRPMFHAWISMIERSKKREPFLSAYRPGSDSPQLSFFFADSRNRVYLIVFAACSAGIIAAAKAQWGVSAALLSFFGWAFCVVGAEAIYRTVIYYKHGIRGERLAYPSRSPGGSFTATNVLAYVPHAVRGYDLRPDTSYVRAVIQNGRVVEAYQATTDRNGNVGFTDTETAEDAFNILVLGDSYTSFPGNGATFEGLEGVEWPYFMKRTLTDAGLKLRVLNYGRLGHGVRQMFDTAADLIDVHKPQLVIVAFITDDLDRFRMWFDARKVGGANRSFRRSDFDAPFEDWAEQEIIDERITLEWAQARIARGDSDPLLEDLVATYDHRKRRSSAIAIDLFATHRLYSWDALFFATPFIDRKPNSARVAWRKSEELSFDDDILFKYAVKKIRGSGARLMLCWIPRKAEFPNGRMTFSFAPQPRLLESLERLAGVTIQPLPSLFQMDPALVEAKYARKSYDEHPSLWMQKLIGLAVAREVRKIIRAAQPGLST